MKKTILTRQQLYDMVWAESLSSIVKKYQLSYSELRKILVEMVIPIPENGYWSQTEVSRNKLRSNLYLKTLLVKMKWN